MTHTKNCVKYSHTLKIFQQPWEGIKWSKFIKEKISLNQVFTFNQIGKQVIKILWILKIYRESYEQVDVNLNILDIFMDVRLCLLKK